MRSPLGPGCYDLIYGRLVAHDDLARAALDLLAKGDAEGFAALLSSALPLGEAERERAMRVGRMFGEGVLLVSRIHGCTYKLLPYGHLENGGNYSYIDEGLREVLRLLPGVEAEFYYEEEGGDTRWAMALRRGEWRLGRHFGLYVTEDGEFLNPEDLPPGWRLVREGVAP